MAGHGAFGADQASRAAHGNKLLRRLQRIVHQARV
jgi:hypothetical protein